MNTVNTTNCNAVGMLNTHNVKRQSKMTNGSLEMSYSQLNQTQSMSADQTNDIIGVLNSFESNTWSALEHQSKIISNICSKLDSISSNDLDFSDITNHTIRGVFEANATGRSVDTNDVFAVLNSFESSTWSAFDHQSNMLKKICSKLDSVSLNTIQVTEGTASTRSALVESIVRNDNIIIGNSLLEKYQNDLSLLNQNINSLSDKLSAEVSERAVLKIMEKNDDDTDCSESTVSANGENIDQNSTSTLIERHKKLVSREIHDNMDCSVTSDSLLFAPNHASLMNVNTDFTQNNMHHNTQTATDTGNYANNSYNAVGEAIYITNFENLTTTAHIYAYIKSKCTIDTNDLNIIRLTKKYQDISALSFVSFKIKTTETLAQQFLAPGFWPTECIAKHFISKLDNLNTINSMDIAMASRGITLSRCWIYLQMESTIITTIF